MIRSGLNAFLTIYRPLFFYRQSNTTTGSVFGGAGQLDTMWFNVPNVSSTAILRNHLG